MKLTRYQNWLDPFEMLEGFDKGITKKSAREFFQFTPELDLIDEESQYKVRLDAPGLKKEDIDISINGSVLTLKGERKDEAEKKGKNFYHSERRFGSFQRVVELPTEVDSEKIKAVYKEGVLEVSIPKSERVKPKQINVDVH